MGTPLRLFLCLFLTGIHISLYSQAEESRPADRVSIKGTYTLKKIFDLIYRQTKQQITYANTLLDDRERVTVDVSGTIDEALTVILAGKAITWVYSEGYVALRKKSAGVRPLSPVIDPPVVTVRGVVTDEEGNPLPGATVKVKGTAKGVSTGVNGGFRIDMPENSVIVVSYTGFEAKEVIIGANKNLLNVLLKRIVSSLDETVVVAYGTTTQRSTVGALNVIKGETIENLPNRSFERSLQGQIPGLLITPGNGQPGGGVSNIVLRGIGTGTDVTKGSNIRNPLFILDGVQITQEHMQTRIGNLSTPVSNTLAQINPSDIENITVLKDASAIALYGSRASNGVILITTKKGKAGKTRINIRHQTDIAARMKGQLKTLNREQYLDLLYDSYRNANPALWTDEKIKTNLISKFPTIVRAPGDTAFYDTPDWFQELYNNHATTISNDISISGGNDYNTYYLNIEYTTQKGIIKKTGYDRASIRYNFFTKPASWISAGINSMFSYNKQNLQSFFEDGSTAAALPYTLSPLLPVRLKNSDYQLVYKYGGSNNNGDISNPAATMEYNANNIVAYRGLTNLYGEINFLNSLKFRSSAGADIAISNNREKIDPRLTQYSSHQNLSTQGYIQEKDITNTIITLTNTLHFEKKFAKHQLNTVVGQEAQVFKSRSNRSLGLGLSSTAYENVNNASTVAAETNSSKQTLLSYFAQANYMYSNRYQLSVGGRSDGSSRFGPKAQFNNYWSAGAAWIITSEPFMQSNSNWLNYAKIRGSLGIAGNANSIPYNTRFDILLNAKYAGTLPAVIDGKAPSNPYIKPEKTLNQDIGIEARFFRERLGFNFDIYRRKITDLLYSMALPGASGGLNVLSNIGDMENKGAELSVQIDVIRNKNIKWNINANWSSNSNKLVKTSNTLTTVLSSSNLINKEGENFNSFYFVRWAGVDPTDGTPQYLDSNGNKTGTFSINNRVIVGKPQPDGFGGITNTIQHDNFELSFFLYYQYGFQIYDQANAILQNDGGIAPYINQRQDALSYWKKPGDQSTNPIRKLNNNNNAMHSRTTRFLYDGDFIRLKNICLSYNFPSSVLKRIKLNAFKVYIQANNIATWTKYPGIDPETTNLGGESAFPYPQQKSFSIGLNAQL